MELKPVLDVSEPPRPTLLIVPYGIETSSMYRGIIHDTLLIVPYGIETTRKLQMTPKEITLLIVPYGIETFYEYVKNGMNDDF